MTDNRLKVVCLIQALTELDNGLEEHTAIALSTHTENATLLVIPTEQRQGTTGRTWHHVRNDISWFSNYALQPSFIASGTWRSLFRIPLRLFEKVLCDTRACLTKTTTNFRAPITPELRLAPFLMYCGGATSEAVGSQLGIGPSTVNKALKFVSRVIASIYEDEINLPATEQELARVMRGFEIIRGLPYCVGAVDGTHIPWPSYPEEQYYEYRCYKGYPSIVLFALVSSDRRVMYADNGRPGVMGDSTIYSLSSLRKKILNGTWLGPDIPSLRIADIDVRPYLIGGCAFTLDVNMMKSSSQTEMKSNPILKTWDGMASQTRKPVECTFGMLKNRFKVLKEGIKLYHEDDISLMCLACVLLHNLCIDVGDMEDHYLPQDEVIKNEVVTAETNAGKKQRDALLYYVIEKLGQQT